MEKHTALPGTSKVAASQEKEGGANSHSRPNALRRGFTNLFGLNSKEAPSIEREDVSSPSALPAANGVTPQRAKDGFQEYLLNLLCRKEMTDLKASSPRGVYVMPTTDLSVWSGVVFVDEGLYEKGMFKFFLQLPDSYPRQRPTVFFLSPIFHPQVHPETGAINGYLERELPTWDPKQHRLSTVLEIVAKLFLVIDTSFPACSDAAELLLASTEEFAAKARESAELSQKQKYTQPQGYSMKFSPYTDVHTKTFESMMEMVGAEDEQHHSEIE